MLPIPSIPDTAAGLIRTTDNPSTTDENVGQLSKLVERTLAALITWSRSLNEMAAWRWEVTGPVTDSRVTVKVGETLMIDTTNNAVTVVLPEASDSNRGRSCGAIRSGGANNVTVVAINSNVNGAASRASNKNYYMSDGQGGWWSW